MTAGTDAAPVLPDCFPVFPLSGALLLPHGRLPLNIFEPRYKAMTEDALGSGRHIAMIQPATTAQPGANGPALHRVGCLGRLTTFSETDDGRYLITLGGVIRFIVAAELDMARGYRRVRGDFSGFMADLAVAEPPAGPVDRAALFAALRDFFRQHTIEPNWAGLEAMSDDALVITLAMGCPFGPLEKQALLEATTLGQRAQTLLALLRIDAHGADMQPGLPS